MAALQPVMLDWEWEAMRKRTNGRAPLHAPTNDYMEDKSGEFLYYTVWSKQPDAQWENLRAGQMCLGREAPRAMPSDAFGYFSKANPDWVETQFGLGVCYLNGLGVDCRSAKGARVARKSRQLPSACWTRGIMGR